MEMEYTICYSVCDQHWTYHFCLPNIGMSLEHIHYNILR